MGKQICEWCGQEYPEKQEAMGDRIREARIEKKLTIRQLAAKIAVQPSWVAQLETGDRVMNVQQAMRLSLVLDVSSNFLYFGDVRL